MHTVTGPGIDEIRIRGGEGVALSRAITAAEAGGLGDASYYVRDDAGAVRARVDRQSGTTVIRAGLDLERGAEDGGEPLRSAASSTRRPGTSGDEPTKEEHEVAEQKKKSADRKRSSSKKRSSTSRSSATRVAPAREKQAAAAPAAAAAVVADGQAGDELYTALLAQVRSTIDGVQEKPNASGTYTRLLTQAGRAFAYVFPPRKGGVALKIPKQLLAVERELPEGHGFKTTGWGLTRTVKDAGEAPVVAKALAVAAKAVAAK